MVNFLSSFLPNLRRLLIPIYDLQKKSKKFKWTEEAEKAFNDIEQLLISPPVLKAPTPNGLFCLENNTSQEGVGGALLQKQGNEWVVIGYHSKRLPQSAKNFRVTELGLTGLLVNIHGFMQLLCNRYFEVLVNHKAIKYMIKSKTESPTTRLKTLDTTQVKRKHGRPPKAKPEDLNPNLKGKTAALLASCDLTKLLKFQAMT